MATAAECREHKDEFIKATDYLLSAPVDVADRKEVNAVAMVWLTNTDEVTLNLDADLLTPIMKEEPELMIIHTIGWSRYVLKTQDTNTARGNLAGIRAVLKYYSEATHKVAPSKRLDKLVKLEKEGKLEEEVSRLVKGR
jgi:hypothetical protein